MLVFFQDDYQAVNVNDGDVEMSDQGMSSGPQSGSVLVNPTARGPQEGGDTFLTKSDSEVSAITYPTCVIDIDLPLSVALIDQSY